MWRHAKPGRNLLRAIPSFFRQLLERLELVGGMGVFAGDVFLQADLVGISLAVSMMPWIDSVFLICLRFTRTSWARAACPRQW